MEDKEFEDLSARMLARIDAALEDCGLDIDVSEIGGGVLQVDFEDGSQIVINRHSAAREIWVAARAGGYHFRFDGEQWVDTRTGGQLVELLSRLLSQQAGEDCRLDLG